MKSLRKLAIGLAVLFCLCQYQTAFALPGPLDHGSGTGVIVATATHNSNGNNGNNGKNSSASNKKTNPPEPVLATAAKITDPGRSFHVGDIITLQCVITPSDAADKTILWSSSDKNIAVISQDGVLTALNPGNVTIKATTANGISDSLKLVISVIDAVSLTIIDPPSKMEVWAKTKLACSFDPENTTDKTLIWTSSDEGVLSVDGYGNIEALKPGEATITVTAANGVNAVCQIMVFTIDVESISVGALDAQYNVGDVIDVAVTLLPDNSTDKDYTLSVSNPDICQVIGKNLVKLLKAGDLTIVVKTANGKETSVQTTVILPVKELKGPKQRLTLSVGKTSPVVFTVAPEDATLPGLNWSSSDTGIATVDGAGNVSGVSPGIATIAAVAYNGVSMSVEVNVVKPFPWPLIIVIIAVAAGGCVWWIMRVRRRRGAQGSAENDLQ